MYIYGCLLIVIAVFILIFKSEKNENKVEEENEKRTVGDTYKLIWQLICKPEIKKLIFMFLTIRVRFSDSVFLF